jgi:hypothetical protein
MKAVIQAEPTGCAIASAAAISGISYLEAKKIANSIEIYVDDPTLWSETDYMRRLLHQLNIKAGSKEVPFKDWKLVPDCALLAIKWHLERNKAYWHWVVFIREKDKSYVLDSKKSLKTNIGTDFGRMKPKWFIEVKLPEINNIQMEE